MSNYPKDEPQQQIENVQKQLNELIDQMRDTIAVMDDPRGEALLETSAEVLSGLNTAFKHYEKKAEQAWR